MTLCLILLVFPKLSAQSTDTGEAEVQERASTEAELIARSLDKDIATAARDELAAWCIVLGLNAEGTVDQLRATLRNHYGISASANTVSAATSGIRIVIESAGRSEYLNLETGGDDTESIVRLSGNVVINVDESERGRTHRVEADTVIFNQAQKKISAVGDIRYAVNTNGNEEVFTGDSLTFEVTDWTGVIFRGTSQRSQEVDGENVEFFFRGESISRVSKDILILEDGIITSHDSDNPDYALKAKKIWITGPGEWGLLGATLYVGHVPVFYIPFYWKSGADLFFNPVIGVRNRSGYYIQTTSYILGRKESDDGFAILGFGDSAGDSYDLERDGAFLVRTPSTGDTPPEKNTLKYMLDWYTTLGGMTGFLGSFPELGKQGSLDFYATVGVSRSIDDTGSPYFYDTLSGRTSVYWNSGYIGSYEIPIRWGTQLDSTVGNWSFYADWYSDPYYMQDFSDRSENFDWLSLLLSAAESEADQPDLVTDMKWEIRGSHSFQVGNAGPWLQSMAIDSFRTALTWRNKENKDITESTSPDRYYDPARDFYYPDQLVMPDIRFSLKGAAPTVSIDRTTESDIGEGTGNLPDNTVDEAANIDLPEVDYIESFTAVYNAGLLDTLFGYGLQSQLYIENKSQSDSWDAPSDIDFLFEAARINTTNSGNMNYGVDFWDGLTGFTGTTNLSWYYQTHSDIFGSGASISDATKLQDYQYTQFLWDNSFGLYLKPFLGIPSFSESALTYNFDGNIYAFRFDDTATVASPDYSGEWIDGADGIRTNEVVADAIWKRWGGTIKTGAIVSIPPLDQRYQFTGSAGYSKDGWAAALSEQINFENDDWTLKPLVMSVSWQGWKDEVKVSQNARYDPDNARWASAESSILFWGFETSFIANYSTAYTWDDMAYLWQSSGETFGASTLRFSYNRDFNPIPFWKNRITTGTTLNTSWNINLRQPTDNVLTFKWTQSFAIFKFLDLRISFSSTNNAMYLYFEGWRNQLGISDDYNFFGDLFKSFNIFNSEDRRDSQFNMDRLDLTLVHHLRNWDLSIEYSGWPALDSGATSYRWKSEFNLFVKWNPLPMFNQRTRFKDDRWTVDSFE